MPKERPILFSAPMVRATLREQDPKTMTRRIVKHQTTNVQGTEYPAIHFDGEVMTYAYVNPHSGQNCQRVAMRCPYGEPGDRLWVKETWRTWRSLNECKPSRIEAGAAIEYAAGGTSLRGVDKIQDGGRWRPSIFMPRWASRITLEITGVRAERLQSITEEDAKAEGIKPIKKTNENCHQFWADYRLGGEGETFCVNTPKESFASLWKHINGPDSWEKNPYVWVVSFKRI